MNITTDQLREVYSISIFAKELDDKVQQLLMAGTISTTWFSWRGSELLGAVVGKSMERRVRDRVGLSHAIDHRDVPVVLPVPHLDRSGDVREAETPVVHFQREVLHRCPCTGSFRGASENAQHLLSPPALRQDHDIARWKVPKG